MWPDRPRGWKSEQNNVFFWEHECKLIGQAYSYENNDKWGDIPYAVRLEEKDYYKALTDKMNNTPEQEIYLRIQAWWLSNDKFRSVSGSGRVKRSSEEIENMKMLMRILNEKNSEAERLMKAELARQLGKFNEAGHLLDFAFHDNYVKVAELLRGLVDDKNMVVQQIQR